MLSSQEFNCEADFRLLLNFSSVSKDPVPQCHLCRRHSSRSGSRSDSRSGSRFDRRSGTRPPRRLIMINICFSALIARLLTWRRRRGTVSQCPAQDALFASGIKKASSRGSRRSTFCSQLRRRLASLSLCRCIPASQSQEARQSSAVRRRLARFQKQMQLRLPVA